MSNNVNLHLTVTIDHTADSDLIAMLKRLAAAGEVALHRLAKLAVTEQENRFEARDEIVRQAVDGLDPFIRQRIANYIDDKMLKERLKLRPANANPIERLAEDIAAADEAPESPVAKTGVPEPSETPEKPARARTQRQTGPKRRSGRPKSAPRPEKDDSAHEIVESMDDPSKWMTPKDFAVAIGKSYPTVMAWLQGRIRQGQGLVIHKNIGPNGKRVSFHIHESMVDKYKEG